MNCHLCGRPSEDDPCETCAELPEEDVPTEEYTLEGAAPSPERVDP